MRKKIKFAGLPAAACLAFGFILLACSGAWASGYALEFDGEGAWLGIPRFSLEDGSAYTLSFWMKKDSGSTEFGPFGGRGDSRYYMRFSPRRNNFYMRFGSTGEAVTLDLNAGVWDDWHMITVAVGEDRTVTLYIDGEYSARDTAEGTASIFERIGGNYMANTGRRLYWKGRLDDIRVYGRTLSGEEVKSLYEGRNITEGLAGHWKLDEGEGVTAADSSPEGRDGTIEGARWVESRAKP